MAQTRARRDLIPGIRLLSPDTWKRTAHHSDYGLITIQALMGDMVKHDVIHLAQIARLVDGKHS
jgi:hypothetical protein